VNRFLFDPAARAFHNPQETPDPRDPRLVDEEFA
jgi:hypothetical protein